MMKAKINGKQIEKFMKKVRNRDESDLISELIAIKCAFWIKNVRLKDLDEKTRKFAIKSCKAALDLDEKSDK